MSSKPTEILISVLIVISMVLGGIAGWKAYSAYERGAKQEQAAKQFLADLRADVDRHTAKIKELEARLPKLPPPVRMKTTFYSDKHHGKKMANGKIFDMHKNTVAHRTLPLGSMLLLEYGGRYAVGEVTDRGPAKWTGNELDVSAQLADKLRMRRAGRAQVQVTRLK